MKISDKTRALFEFDDSFRTDGHMCICGADEAGRGPLAGPVVCAAVIMPHDAFIAGINDSKKVSESERERLHDLIVSSAIAYHVAVIDHQVIDEINILEATKRGMEQAILSLAVRPEAVLVDAVSGLKINRPYTALIKGDAKSYAIAAASILAKVTRDRIMREYAKEFPGYGFDRHKGYGTSAHIEAIREMGKCPIHRETFIKRFVNHES